MTPADTTAYNHAWEQLRKRLTDTGAGIRFSQLDGYRTNFAGLVDFIEETTDRDRVGIRKRIEKLEREMGYKIH